MDVMPFDPSDPFSARRRVSRAVTGADAASHTDPLLIDGDTHVGRCFALGSYVDPAFRLVLPDHPDVDGRISETVQEPHRGRDIRPGVCNFEQIVRQPVHDLGENVGDEACPSFRDGEPLVVVEAAGRPDRAEVDIRTETVVLVDMSPQNLQRVRLPRPATPVQDLVIT
jgi:hypothetical protein